MGKPKSVLGFSGTLFQRVLHAAPASFSEALLQFGMASLIVQRASSEKERLRSFPASRELAVSQYSKHLDGWQGKARHGVPMSQKQILTHFTEQAQMYAQ